MSRPLPIRSPLSALVLGLMISVCPATGYGDVHQPLHAADDHDRGGNDLRVQTATDPAGSLHTYWDTVFVERLGTRPDEVAAKLVARISADQRRSWSSGSPTDWAKESFEIARTHVYGKLPGHDARAYAGDGRGAGPGAGLLLDPEYQADAESIVAARLQRAGVRLAGLLNDALR
jgi:S1/P1 Nuclease